MSEKRTYGAMPPPDLAWQIGKTAATISFVNEAEAALTTRSDLTEDEAYALRAKVDRLKDGGESLEDWETLEDWLKRLRDHYP